MSQVNHTEYVREGGMSCGADPPPPPSMMKEVV